MKQALQNFLLSFGCSEIHINLVNLVQIMPHLRNSHVMAPKQPIYEKQFHNIISLIYERN